MERQKEKIVLLLTLALSVMAEHQVRRRGFCPDSQWPHNDP